MACGILCQKRVSVGKSVGNSVGYIPNSVGKQLLGIASVLWQNMPHATC